jgi:hypothetical protein
MAHHETADGSEKFSTTQAVEQAQRTYQFEHLPAVTKGLVERYD